MTDLTTAATTAIAEKDDRIVRQQIQIDRLLTNTETDQRTIADLNEEISMLRKLSRAGTSDNLCVIVQEAIEVDGISVTVEDVEDESFTLRVNGATIRDREIVAPTRRFRVDGTVTAPVSFIVEARDESEAEMLADDVLREVSMNVESDLDMASPDDCTDFGAGMVEGEVEGVYED